MGDFSSTVQYLDFSKEQPTARDSASWTWFDWSGEELHKLKSSIESVIQHYGSFLDSETVAKLEEPTDTEFVAIQTTLSDHDILQLDQEKGHDRIYSVLLGMDEIIDRYNELLPKIVFDYSS